MRFAILAGLLAASAIASARAEQIECDDPVDSRAIIGFPPGADVVHYEDDKEKTCRFSVDGWSAGSPPREELLSARGHIRETMAKYFAPGIVERPDLAREIAIYLAAASPFENGDPRLSESPYVGAISGCLANYPDPDRRSFLPHQDVDVDVEGFWCAIIDPRHGGEALAQLNEFLAQGVEKGVRVVELTVPYAVFRNDRAEGREFLFLALPAF